MKLENLKSQWRKIFFFAVLLVIYVPLLRGYFDILSERKHYALFPLLMIVVMVIFCLRWYKAPVASSHPRLIYQRIVFMAALLIMPIAMLYYAPWLVAFSALLAAAAGAMYISSFRKVENIFGIWLLLWFLLRLPNQADIRLFNWMESVSSRSASLILDYLGMLHVAQGPVFSLPTIDFSLNLICSGEVSLVSVVAMAAVICVGRNRKAVHTLMMLICGVVVTWLLNVLRILFVMGLYAKFDVDLTLGEHAYVYTGVSFFIALGMLLSCDAFWTFIFTDDTEVLESQKEMSRESKNIIIRSWIRFSDVAVADTVGKWLVSSKVKPQRGLTGYSVFLSLVIVCILVLEGTVIYYSSFYHRRDLMHGEGGVTIIDEKSVLFDRPGWEVVGFSQERRDFSNIWGALSSTWRLKFNQHSVVMSLDYPFDGWHDVKHCYTKIGWKIVDEQIVEKEANYKWSASQTDMTLPSGDYGFIMCSHFDHLGKGVEPKPATHKLNMIRYRLHPDRWVAPFGDSLDKDRNTYYQAQVMVSTAVPLDRGTEEEIKVMYATFREQARRAVAKQADKK